MLTARRRMLNKLNVLVEHRRAIISQLGLELLQTAQVIYSQARLAVTGEDFCISIPASIDPASDNRPHGQAKLGRVQA